MHACMRACVHVCVRVCVCYVHLHECGLFSFELCTNVLTTMFKTGI